MKSPIDQIQYVPVSGPNSFGYVRTHDIHTGVDLFADHGTPVYAMEDGVVVSVGSFTGESCGTPWWNETGFVLISGKSGNILYGEIKTNLSAGQQVLMGQVIGTVLTVLKKDKGSPTSMLHIELYQNDYVGSGEVWLTNRPEKLLDPTNMLLEMQQVNNDSTLS